MPPAAEGPSPEDWRAFRQKLVSSGLTLTTDDGTGRKYYYNATTDATSWELPISARVVTPAPGAYESSYGGGGGGGYGNYDTSGYGNSYAPAADYGSYDAYGNYPQSASV